MRAVAYHHAGPVSAADAFIDIEIDKPVPGPRDLLVKVEAVSVNPVDVKNRAGTDPGDAHARRVLRRPGRFTVTLHYLDPFDPADYPDRKALAAETRARIANA